MSNGKIAATTLAVVLFALAGLPAPGASAAETISGDIARGLASAALSGDARRFESAVRAAIAAAPDQKSAILHHVVSVYPDLAVAMLSSGLSAAPAVDASERSAPSVGAAAPPPPEAPQATPSPPSETPAPAWSGSVALGATARTGNTDNVGATGEVDLTYKAGHWKHIGKTTADYLRTREGTQEQAFDAEYQARYNLSERTFLYGLTRYEDDRFSGFDFEFTASTGLGRDLFKGPDFEWTLAAGPTYRIARRADEDHSEHVPGGRLINTVSWRFSDSATLSNETELLADRDRFRAQNELGLKMRLIDRLSAKLSFKTDYRSDIPEDAKHTDTTTRGSLVYDF